ncbi:MAG: hypothetical protein ACM3SV_08370 [Betaproteobacteria bacterium]
MSHLIPIINTIAGYAFPPVERKTRYEAMQPSLGNHGYHDLARFLSRPVI